MTSDAAVAATTFQSSRNDCADKIRPVRNNATPAAALPINERHASASASSFKSDSESRIPNAGAITTGLVSARRTAVRICTADISAPCALPLLISTMIRVSGLMRIEPEAGATATGTVPVGPSTEDTIGRPTPAKFGKPIVSACSDASDLDTLENVRTAKYQAT